MLAKACALVLEDYPIVNARYEPGQTVYQKDINVAMAVAIDGGLITPTLKVGFHAGLCFEYFSSPTVVFRTKRHSIAVQPVDLSLPIHLL